MAYSLHVGMFWNLNVVAVRCMTGGGACQRKASSRPTSSKSIVTPHWLTSHNSTATRCGFICQPATEWVCCSLFCLLTTESDPQGVIMERGRTGDRVKLIGFVVSLLHGTIMAFCRPASVAKCNFWTTGATRYQATCRPTLPGRLLNPSVHNDSDLWSVRKRLG